MKTNTCLQNLVEQPEKYELGYYDFAEDIGVYTLAYYFRHQGINTEDYVYIMIDGEGSLVSYGIPNEGKFDDLMRPFQGLCKQE